MLERCPGCGRYSVETPCYECLVKERDRYRQLADADAATLVGERDKYKKLYEMALSTCPLCRENCALRRFGERRAAGE